MRVVDEEQCRFCGFWHFLKARECCSAAKYAAELEGRLEWVGGLAKSSQEQTHALYSLARLRGIPQGEIDDAMLVGCPGCPQHTPGEN